MRRGQICSDRAGPKRFKCPVGLRGHIEVALGQSIDLVGPDLYLAFSPGQVQIRMMAFRLRHRPDLVDKRECLRKVFERIEPLEMAFGVLRPAPAQLFEKRLDPILRKRRDATPARDAFIVRKTHDILLEGRSLHIRSSLITESALYGP